MSSELESEIETELNNDDGSGDSNYFVEVAIEGTTDHEGILETRSELETATDFETSQFLDEFEETSEPTVEATNFLDDDDDDSSDSSGFGTEFATVSF